MYQLRNLLHQTNVTRKPAKDFNADDDFFNLIITSHILTATLNVLNMKSLQQTPTLPELEDAWLHTKDRRKHLQKSC